MSEPLEAFQDRLGYRFRDGDLLVRALTHRSYANELALGENYERLEFLGDAVLAVIAAEWLFQRFPTHAEGDLSKLKSHVVSEPVLARHARSLGVGEVLRLGVGEARSGGRDKSSLLADSLEAILGAAYLDGGLEPSRALVEGMLEGALAGYNPTVLGDPKTRLQEFAQAQGWALPEYRHVSDLGPDHDKTFHVECWLADAFAGEGRGRTKKAAEQAAAAAALEQLSERLGGRD